MDVDTLINSYVSNILQVARDGLDIDDFYKEFSKGVRKELEFDQKDFLHFHHPFHWALFSDNNFSPFEYIQARKIGESTRIGLKREVTHKELFDFVKRKYADYLEARLNNPHQES